MHARLKVLRISAMIWATVVNTHTHTHIDTQRETASDQLFAEPAKLNKT